ncbi:MAG: 2,3-bisphosphoglycerate-independent phosphoglycerate mutase [Magnetospiraceae bacterium]
MSDQTIAQRPVVLCILDGWGVREESTNNAIALAPTPTWDRLWATCPTARLEASAQDVGLPAGQMGNSEVGHMNLGAGRVVMQDLPRIDTDIETGAINTNPALLKFRDDLLKSGGACHMVGLLSPGGVHSMQDHMVALARVLDDAGVPVRIHALLDGRDTPPSSAKGFMETFLADIAGLKDTQVATVGGRYWGMDRDKRWERVTKAYACMVDSTGEAAPDPLTAIQNSYDAGKTDEFMEPTAIDGFAGMADGDGLLMANFRADRAREILTALVDPAFDGFARARTIDFAGRAGMVEYSSALNPFFDTLFGAEKLQDILGELVSNAGKTQLRIAETEKYAHVTFFLNGGEETVYPGEERILVSSPKVATYDLQPEMSAPEVTDKLVAAIEGGTFDLIVVNFANGDMVGHTGILAAAMTAAQTIDASLARLEAAVKAAGGALLVTADHGNCEMMEDPETHGPHTAHTTNKVPLILVNGPADAVALKDGILADVAPTVLELMGLAQPAAMTGQPLIVHETRRESA